MKNLSDGDYCTVTAPQACDRLAIEDILFLLAGVRRRPAEIETRRGPEKLADRPFDRIVQMMSSQVVSGKAGDGRPRAGAVMGQTALAAVGPAASSGGPVHELLASSWSTQPGAAGILRRALVLCADHELNASAYAARVAASAEAGG